MTRKYKYLLGFLSFAAAIFTIGQVLALAMTPPGEPEVEGEVGVTHGHVVLSDEPLAAGRVVAVDRAARRITLEYLPIPQLFLEGGTRIFHVREPVSLEGLGPGDKVRFEVERDARTYTITRIRNSN
jgi:Cu/Ag efflux protein CusF